MENSQVLVWDELIRHLKPDIIKENIRSGNCDPKGYRSGNRYLVILQLQHPHKACLEAYIEKKHEPNKTPPKLSLNA